MLDGVLIHLSSPDCDVAWSSFDTPEEVMEKITGLRYPFLTTYRLQEISISPGWWDKYINLAARFVRAIGEWM